MEKTEEQLARIRDFVAALRSGEYAQAKHTLRTEIRDNDGGYKIGYCCEGVAFTRYGEQLGYTLTGRSKGQICASYERDDVDGQRKTWSSTAVAPPSFWDDMGMLANPATHNGLIFVLPDDCATSDDNRPWEEYASLNDAGLTFDQIADLIEWQFLSNVEVTS